MHDQRIELGALFGRKYTRYGCVGCGIGAKPINGFGWKYDEFSSSQCGRAGGYGFWADHDLYCAIPIAD